MKPKDATPGVVYGYKPGKYDALRPVLIVDNTYWRRASHGYGHTAATDPFEFYSLDAYDATQEARAKAAGRTYRKQPRGYSGGDMIPEVGLPGLDVRTTRGGLAYRDEETRAADAEALTALARRMSAAELRTEFAALPYGGRSFRPFADARAHLFNPAWLLGEWAEVYGAQQDEAERRRILNAEAKAASDERVARAVKRVEALRALDLPGDIDEPQESTGWRHSGAEWTPDRYTGNTGHVKLTLGQVDALLSLIPDGARFVPDDVEDDGWTLRRPEYEAESDGEEDDGDDTGE